MSEPTKLTVYGVGTSRALRAHWAMAELGLPYRTEQIQSRSGQTQTPAYTQLDPRQKIPVLQDDDFILSESSAIITYLAETYGTPDNQLVPTDPRQRARYNEWVSFICMELDATSLYVLRRHEGLPQIYGEAPVANQAARAYFTRMIEAAAVRFDENCPYLLGERFTGADMLMMTILGWAKNLEPPIPLPAVFEVLHDRIAERPAYQSAVIANTPEGPRAP
ncbi:MAG: glutathione S-transferase family protein [Hyphomicrobiaceae bacterium]